MRFNFLLTSSILGFIGAAATSTTVFAQDTSSTFYRTGFYAGVQGGRSDTFYAGRSFGQTPTPTNSTQVTTTPDTIVITTVSNFTQLSGQHVDDIGIGGRIYAGYQFNPYFALETGYTRYGKTSFNYTSKMTQNIFNSNMFPGFPELDYSNSSNQVWTYQHTGDITQSAIDLVVKATLPLNHGLGLYAKAGAAYIQAKTTDRSLLISNVYADNGTGNNAASNPLLPSSVTTQSSQAFRPVAGVGVNYTVPHSNVSIDGSYSRVFSTGAIPQASLLALGLEYKFS